MSVHYVRKCRLCDAVIEQCRCISKDKPVEVSGTCYNCNLKAEYENAEIRGNEIHVGGAWRCVECDHEDGNHDQGCVYNGAENG